ncbi:MAG: hypothetical protein C0423_14030 [Methylibium sp.]|nr:hypothetical protein [Methylibium sp.]
MNKTPPAASRRPVQTYACAANGCQHVIEAPMLMCVEHWRLVPAALKREVWAWWRLVGRRPEARERHRAAVQAAIDAVHQKQLARKARSDAATRPLF